MKKITKFCAITSLLMISLGIMVLIASCSLGGIRQIRDMAENGDLYIFADNDGYIDFDDWEFRDNMEALRDGSAWEESYDYNWNENWDDIFNEDIENAGYNMDFISEETIKKLNLSIAGGAVIIRETDGEFQVRSSQHEKLNCYTQGEELIIEDKEKHRPAFYNRRKIWIDVPKGYQFREADIEMGAGAIKLEYLNADELDISVGSGLMEAQDILSKDCNITVGAGMVKAENAQFANADIAVGAGMAEISGSVTKNLEAECDMGTLTLDLLGNANDFNYDLECDLGSIIMDNKSMSGATSQKINNNAAKNMDLSCDLGVITVKMKGEK